MTTISDVTPEQVWTAYHAAEAAGDAAGMERCARALAEWTPENLEPVVAEISAAELRRRPPYEPDEDDDSDPADHGIEHDYDEAGP